MDVTTTFFVSQEEEIARLREENRSLLHHLYETQAREESWKRVNEQAIQKNKKSVEAVSRLASGIREAFNKFDTEMKQLQYEVLDVP